MMNLAMTTSLFLFLVFSPDAVFPKQLELQCIY